MNFTSAEIARIVVSNAMVEAFDRGVKPKEFVDAMFWCKFCGADTVQMNAALYKTLPPVAE